MSLNKLERFVPDQHFRVVPYLRLRLGANPIKLFLKKFPHSNISSREERMEGAQLRQALALLTIIRLRREGLLVTNALA